MLIEKLDQLRRQSDAFLLKQQQGVIPPIRLSLPQLIEKQDAMLARMQTSPERQAKAHHFLASHGFSTDFISAPIDTSNMFELVQYENHTDIESFLAEKHEQDLIGTIEDRRAENYETFDDFYETQFESFMEENANKELEEEENRMDVEEYNKHNNNTGVNIINEYANVITTLNANRLIDTDYDLLSHLSHIKNSSDIQKNQDASAEAWNIVTHLVDSSNSEGKSEGRFLPNYITKPYNSIENTNTRRALIYSAKSWLEKQSAQIMNDTINRNARKINVGGIPSVDHRLRAFIDLVFKNSAGWVDNRLEISEDLPIWAFVYLLMRIGHLDILANFVNTHRELFTTERKFVGYFEEYMNSPNHCVTAFTQKSIFTDYQRFYYGEQNSDPYKVLIYKIIGRCELHKKTYHDIIKTTEDYLWLQLMLIREVTDIEAYDFERYRLEDVQKDISKLGNTYFDNKDSNPWTYFKILLLTLQFEEAIQHLYNHLRLRPETVHFSIALAYFGLLRIPQIDQTNTHAILLHDKDNNVSLNFARLIYQYVQAHIPDKPKEALNYLAVLTLYTRKQGYLDDDMIFLAKSYICKFTMKSSDFRAILGTQMNEGFVGLMNQINGLLAINSPKEYAENILYQIADDCVQKGRLVDAVYVYSVSRDYNQMMDVLSKGLSDALQKPQSYRLTEPTSSTLSNHDIIQFATNAMKDYERNQYVSQLVDSDKKLTVEVLIQLLQFRIYYEQGEYERALQLMQQLQIIPIQDSTMMTPLLSSFATFPVCIQKNVPEILLNIMDILYKLWTHGMSSPATTHVSQLDSLEYKSRTVLHFAGLLPFSIIPNEIIVRMNKVDMAMSSRRR